MTMVNQLRAVARRSLHRVGLQRIANPSLVDLMIREKIDCVFDVGANRGQFGKELRDGGYQGRIVSFEPMSAAFTELARNAARDPSWTAHNFGLGESEGQLEISIKAKDVYSSFKPNSDFTNAKFSGARETHRETVQVKRLDRFLDENSAAMTPRSYLKIDTQGFEKEVVEGAGEALNRFVAVQMELALRPLYDGQMPFVDMIKWMQDSGFEIAMAKENGFDHGECRLLELDVAFVRRDA